MNLKIFKGFERFDGNFPTKAVKYAMEHREEAIPELLEIMEYTLSNAKKLAKEKDRLIQIPAVYLLAYFRESKAYEYVVKLAYLPDNQSIELFGSAIADDYARILASVCDGNLDPIKNIIEDSSLDEYVRDEALYSLLILLNEGKVTREHLVFYFKSLFNGKLKADYSAVWDELPSVCCLIHPKGLENDIVKAVDDGKVMEVLAELDFVEEQLERPVEEVLEELKDNEDLTVISEYDIYGLEDWVGVEDDEYDLDDDFFSFFGEDSDGEDDEYWDEEFDDEFDEDFEDDEEPFGKVSNVIPFNREFLVGRNDPCPCGSGKKYKNCCGKKGN
ncbi:MAG: DUF1186 domain-containing protein [Clostridia bacterium]|jgi:hypothetical protein|nr:DUF1186 domain-containing protein [Clostridiaceae bacterium]